VKDPEEALAAARQAASTQNKKYNISPEPPWASGDPAASARRLAEWAIIEPDENQVRSTRRNGRPITAVKLLLVRLLRQYIGQTAAQQSRFNAQVAAHVVRLEERVAELEEIVRRDRDGSGGGAPPTA
jgi:hypothetical protein